jgi:hypothetical protein
MSGSWSKNLIDACDLAAEVVVHFGYAREHSIYATRKGGTKIVMRYALLRVAHAYKNAEGVERQLCTGPHLAPDAHLTPGCSRAVAIGVRTVNAHFRTGMNICIDFRWTKYIYLRNTMEKQEGKSFVTHFCYRCHLICAAGWRTPLEQQIQNSAHF